MVSTMSSSSCVNFKFGNMWFEGTGTAHRPDEQDLKFKITLIPTFDANMHDRSWIGAV